MAQGVDEPRLDTPAPDVDENGVDLAQIRAMLALTPAQRLTRMTAFLNSLLAIRARDGGTKPA